ncbi:MAG: thiamine pyrophosphate-dependent enzyme [Gallintestinimicrobium sp.]
MSCPYIIEELDRITKGNAIITTDVGQHQMWAAQYYHYTKPRTFLSSGGLGTMGYGIGACIGAKTGCPDKICVNIGGDGCFRMNLIELATASRYQIRSSRSSSTIMFWAWCASGRRSFMENAIPRRFWRMQWITAR